MTAQVDAHIAGNRMGEWTVLWPSAAAQSLSNDCLMLSKGARYASRAPGRALNLPCSKGSARPGALPRGNKNAYAPAFC